MDSSIRRLALAMSLLVLLAGPSARAQLVPTDIQQPGTQSGEVTNIQNVSKCDNCHGGYGLTTEPARNWRGSMMAQASRDPIFWVTVAVANQDFPGAGDLCIRCHTPDGWPTKRCPRPPVEAGPRARPPRRRARPSCRRGRAGNGHVRARGAHAGGRAAGIPGPN